MTEIKDEPMKDVPKSSLPLAEQETRILELYDRLQELRLEVAIINAQRSHRQNPRAAPSDEALVKAQTDLVEARARYKLRQEAVEAVMVAKPILEAVHNGADASPVERDLLPYIEQRDETAKKIAKQATTKGLVLNDANQVQSETLRLTRENVDLTARLLDLAEQVKNKKEGQIEDARTRRDLEKSEGELKASKMRWRVMKAVAGGVVAGSGVDWARDDELRDIVLDPEDEDKI